MFLPHSDTNDNVVYSVTLTASCNLGTSEKDSEMSMPILFLTLHSPFLSSKHFKHYH